jgi:hypothetical protein
MERRRYRWTFEARVVNRDGSRLELSGESECENRDGGAESFLHKRLRCNTDATTICSESISIEAYKLLAANKL